MAIAGLLVHARKDALASVEIKVGAMDGLSCYGVHDEQFIVTVAEVPAEKMNETVEAVKALDGVLTVYTTYLTVEDEMDEQGNIQTNLDIGKVLGKKTARHTLVKP